jgi:hypothetical protein
MSFILTMFSSEKKERGLPLWSFDALTLTCPNAWAMVDRLMSEHEVMREWMHAHKGV